MALLASSSSSLQTEYMELVNINSQIRLKRDLSLIYKPYKESISTSQPQHSCNIIQDEMFCVRVRVNTLVLMLEYI